MGSLSLMHWLAVLLVVLLLFGPSRIAGIGKALGEGIRGLKRGIADEPADARVVSERRNG